MKDTIRTELIGIVVLVGAMWAVYILDLVLPGNLASWGVVPRTLGGLVGIPASPFLHASFGHILGNTIPLVVVLILLAGSRSRTFETVAEVALLGGALLWIFGRNGTPTEPIVHVGASGLVYGLIAFLIVAGFRERHFVSLAVAIIVAVMYGTTLLSGVLPSMRGNVSWDGHLTGAIAGAALAYFTLGKPDTESHDGAKLPV